MEKNDILIEEPKARMLKNIIRLWGIKNTDELDPLVRILVDALSGEVYKINQDVLNFDKRILEKMAQIMTPVSLSLPNCAHSIMHALSNESVEIISSKTSFLYTSKQQSNNLLKNIFFTPVVDTQIIDARVQYIYSNNSLYECNGLDKILKNKKLKEAFDAREIWVGIKINSEIDFLNKIHFYFQLLDDKSNKYFFSMLANSKWYFKGCQINITQGFFGKRMKREDSVWETLNPIAHTENETCNFYHDKFVTIDDSSLDVVDIETSKELYPEVFENYFSSSELLTLFKEPLIWFNIKSSLPIPEHISSELSVHTNAFPVVNRQLQEFNHRLRGITNIVPIRTGADEFFLSMESVADSANKKYTSIPYADGHTTDNDCYVLRKGGTERMDARSAKEYLQYVLTLIRDEASAFASYGTDAIGTLLKDMDRLIAQLEQRLAKSTQANMDYSYYVLLPQQRSDEVFFLSYWITNGVLANGIHARAQLTEAKGSQLKKGSMYLMRPSVGGKATLGEANQIDAFKYSILTHDRIITAEDIKAFCRLEFGALIEPEIVVRKALVLSDSPKEGLVRCVEILIKKKQSAVEEENGVDWDTELKLVQTKMEARSSLNLRMVLKLID